MSFKFIIITFVYLLICIVIPAYCVSLFIILLFILRCVRETPQPRGTEGEGQEGEAPDEGEDEGGGAPRQDEGT